MKHILLLGNDPVLTPVLAYLTSLQDVNVTRCAVSDRNSLSSALGVLADDQVEFVENAKDQDHLIDLASAQDIDWIISCYWPYKVPDSLLNRARDSINFHPSLLPWGAGWYPHVHAMNQNRPIGVTLHRMSAEFDQGDLWVQRQIPLHGWENATQVHEKCANAIVEVFKESWEQISNGAISPSPQNLDEFVFFRKFDSQQYDELDLNRVTTGRDFLTQLLSRQWKGDSFAWVKIDGRKLKIRLHLGED